MEIRDAIELLRDAIDDAGGVWADLGAGTGTFALALAEILGRGATVYAVDDDPNAIRELNHLSAPGETRIVPVQADITKDFELPGFGNALLDGLLLANALHFVRDATRALTRLVRLVRPGGRVIVVEYDRRGASRWVPYPIPAARWPALANAAGLSDATITARRPSAYSGILYVGAATKPERPSPATSG